MPIRTPPIRGEGIWGWALRMAELNGHPDPSWILTQAGILGRRHVARRDVMHRLAEMVGRSPEDFAELIPLKRGTGYSRSVVPGLELPPWMVASKHFSVCPRCLAERRVVPAIWDLGFWTCCPWHNCRLAISCPACGALITWRRPGINRCSDPHCDGLLSNANPEPAPQAEIEVILLLAEKLAFSDLPRRSTLWHAFGHLDATDIIRLIAGIGLPLTSLGGHRRQRITRPEDVMKATSDVLMDWPHHFHLLLGEFASDAAGRRSLRHRFAGFYYRLLGQGSRSSLLPSAARSVLIDELVAHLDETASLQQPAGRNSTGQWINRHHAARKLGINENTILRMVRLAARGIVRN
ncbi:TniQ family protein [Microvirga arabica]|nr:TniQ family protein [Microvirga arabica]